MTPADLPRAWRARATELRRFGAEPQAVTHEVLAAELDAALADAGDEELTLTAAGEESGYSTRRLAELIADGTIPQAGRKGRPRIRRADLPKRAGARKDTTTTGYDPEADAASLLRKAS